MTAPTPGVVARLRGCATPPSFPLGNSPVIDDGRIVVERSDVLALLAVAEAAAAQVESERHNDEHADMDGFGLCYFDEESWPCPTQRLRDALAALNDPTREDTDRG